MDVGAGLMRTRFAPSPTGPLHLGHAYSALLAYDMARDCGGEFLLRIEDTDTARCRADWVDLIHEDLHWLGISWSGPAMMQSAQTQRYELAISRLGDMGLLFPCGCSRADIRAAMSAPQEGGAPPEGVYPGTCRHRPMGSRSESDALRLNITRAIGNLPRLGGFYDTGTGADVFHAGSAERLITGVGDVVLCRKDARAVSYVLASVVDDAAQNISHVIRGEDLFEITRLQVLLQNLLGLATPIYHHHRLIRDETGKRLAKRDDARAIRLYRAEGATPDDIRRMVGLGPPSRE
jgi:glutamyl-Q tRNA(Asp) synthetase